MDLFAKVGFFYCVLEAFMGFCDRFCSLFSSSPVTLYDAAWEGNLEAVRQFVKAPGIDVVNSLCISVKGTALIAATVQGHLKVVKYLCKEAKADTTIRVTQLGEKWNALRYAIWAGSGNLEVILFLLGIHPIDDIDVGIMFPRGQLSVGSCDPCCHKRGQWKLYYVRRFIIKMHGIFVSQNIKQSVIDDYLDGEFSNLCLNDSWYKDTFTDLYEKLTFVVPEIAETGASKDEEVDTKFKRVKLLKDLSSRNVDAWNKIDEILSDDFSICCC